MTPLVIEALCDHLSEKPGLYLEEMVVFLCDEFQVMCYALLAGHSMCGRIAFGSSALI